MKIYYNAVSSWDGNHYTLDCIRPFLTKQKRNEAYEKMRLAAAYKNGDICLNVDEDEVEDAPEEAMEGTMYEQPDGTTFLDCQASFPEGTFHHEDKVRVILCKKED